MRGVQGVTKCHPERKHLSKGLCRNCYWAKWRLEKPDQRAKDLLMSRYGITLNDYNKKLKRQGGVCAICKRPYKRRRLCVDHNHKTGKIRGLLCDNCNKNVGVYELHHKKINKYLEKYK